MSVEGLEAGQEEILKKFRETVSDALKPEHDDHYLVKWLRARKFDIVKAEQMFRKHVIWRKKWGIDTILEDFEVPEVMRQYWAGGQFGFDKLGHPIRIDMCGHVDVKGMTYSCKRRIMMKYCFYEIERCLQRGREHGKKIGKRIDMAVGICDMDGFTWSKIWVHGMDIYPKVMAGCEANYPETVYRVFVINGMDIVPTLMAAAEANYPERVYRIYVVNAPAVFPIVFNICKPFLSEDTKKKIIMLGGDWRERLLEYIDADQLPQHWGGTCVDPDGNPYCRSQINLGGEVPKSYYLTENTQMDPDKAKTIFIGPGSSHAIEFKVTKPGPAIRWQFKTKSRDIKFGIVCKQKPGSADTNEELVPVAKYNSHIIPQEGEVRCPGVGIYEARFDNSYSWIYTKELTHQVELVEDFDLDLSPSKNNGANTAAANNTF